MQNWFSKLLIMDKSEVEKEIRNEYMWFILLMLQCQKIREPFNSMPPPDFGALRDVVVSKNCIDIRKKLEIYFGLVSM